MARVINLIIGVVVSLGLVFLYFKTQALDTETHNEITNIVRELKALDARWNESVLKSGFGINTNYDPVVILSEKIQILDTNLVDEYQFIFDDHEKIKQLFNNYIELIKQKTEIIERFKGEYAILRNSLAFLPVAIRNLENQLDIIYDGKDTDQPLISHVKNLKKELLEYYLVSNPELLITIKADLDWLEVNQDSYGLAYGEAVHNSIGIVTNHARTLVKQQPIVEMLLDEIFNLPTDATIDAFYQNYNEIYHKKLVEINIYHSLLVILSIFMVIWIIYIGIQLQLSNSALEKANDNLEQKVIERTQKLSKAYEELKQSQVQLVQSAKMASLGQMIAGVAHEINTPLGYVRSNTSLILEQFAEFETFFKDTTDLSKLLLAKQKDKAKLKFKEVLQHIKEYKENDSFLETKTLLESALIGVDQIADLVKNLKDFSRLDKKHAESINLNVGLDSVLSIAKHVLKNKITIIKDYGEIDLVKCSPSQINQVFLNIIVNAAQAIEDKGEITLSTRNYKESVQIIIADNGPGIPEDILPHIFEPFFTTKEVGKGTGLGLSIVYKIIEEHQGTITVESHIDVGTSFIISLPKIQQTQVQQTELAVA